MNEKWNDDFLDVVSRGTKAPCYQFIFNLNLRLWPFYYTTCIMLHNVIWWYTLIYGVVCNKNRKKSDFLGFPRDQQSRCQQIAHKNPNNDQYHSKSSKLYGLLKLSMSAFFWIIFHIFKISGTPKFRGTRKKKFHFTSSRL